MTAVYVWIDVHTGQLLSHKALKNLFECMCYSKNKLNQVIAKVNKLNLPTFYLKAGKSGFKDCLAGRRRQVQSLNRRILRVRIPPLALNLWDIGIFKKRNAFVRNLHNL